MSGLDAARRHWFETACARISPSRLERLIIELTNRHSPTGAERRACEFLVDHLSAAGLEARYQAVAADSGNCIARIPGDGRGPVVMLYAPIDTHLDADAELDVPWVGPQLRADMMPMAQMRDGSIIGLGASNPKSMVASVAEAACCLRDAAVPLHGDVLVACCGGGMPWIAGGRGNAGLSSGVRHLLSHGVTADCAVILKTWDEVYHEHPGLAWFRIRVLGSLGYAGIPRGIPEFRSSIVPAARLILELEQWLGEYPARHQSAQVRPEGAIAAVRAGWPDKPAFPSAATEIYVDLRTTPDQTMSGIKREFDEFIGAARARYPDVEITWEMLAFRQGSRTDPEHWIVQSALRAWAETHGRPYPGAPPMSGQTDAAAICEHGIPVVRVGFPFPAATPTGEFRDGLGGMGVANVAELLTSIRLMIYMLIDSCTRTREETVARARARSTGGARA